MKTILVPVDFSKYSENALQLAAKIAKDQNAEIVAVHMLGLSDAVLTKEEDAMEGMFYLQLAQKRFKEFLDKSYLEDITVHQTVKNYQVFSEIDDVAKQHKADLIIMGSHGSTGLKEVFVGSNTEKVVRTASAPVMVVKHESEFEFKKGVFVCDFELENLSAYKDAFNLFKTFDIEMKLLYVNTSGESFRTTSEIEEKIKEFTERLEGKYAISLDEVAIYNEFTVEKGIFNYAKKISANIIGIPTHGRRGLAHFFSGSIGEDVVNHSHLPVVTFKL